MAIEIKGGATTNEVEVNETNQLQVITGQASSPATVGGIRIFSENDTGEVTGDATLKSPETDQDYRLRMSPDVQLDNEVFDYTAQNTGKYLYRTTTMTNAWSASGLTTNSGNITTTTTGTVIQSYGYFALIGTTSLYVQFELAFTAQPTTNTIIDFGIGLPAAANPYAPTDGAYFRLTSAGLVGIINSSTTETSTGLFTVPWTYVNSEKHQFIIVIGTREVEFWIDNVLQASVPTPIGQGSPFMSAALPWFLRHAIAGGAAGAAISCILSNVAVNAGGLLIADKMSSMGNRIFGSYQGLSGGTMGSLANYANSANPTAAVPTNTTAALGSGLGGQFWETDTLAVTNDGIICSYQVPAGTVNIQGRRLVLRGVNIQSFVQTVLTGGGYVAQWGLAFGHTAVSLATAEGVAAKSPRRVGIGLQAVASAAAAGTVLTALQINFDSPIYVNPGEFIAVFKKKVGTAPSAGVIGHLITYDYGWE